MIVRVYVHYENGEKLERPKEYSGVLKMYANKGEFDSHYLLLRDIKTNQSMIPPLYDFYQMYINGVDNLVFYKGKSKETDEKHYQVWAINYCDGITINQEIENARLGAKDTFSFDDEQSLNEDLKL